MKKAIIESNLRTLKKSYLILDLLSDLQYSDSSIAPYYSSIGSHLRHILDFYNCILFPESKTVDLTNRKRDLNVEISCSCAKEYFLKIILKLEKFNSDFNTTIFVFDNLGNGKIKIPYTYSALFAQANSHTIHHYAIINYILEGLDIHIDDHTFGFNQTTPKKV